MNASQYNATVVQKILIRPNLMILRVTTDEPRMTFASGQYTTLGLYGYEPRSENSEPEAIPSNPDKLIQRAYSIASARHETQQFEFYISQVKTGQLTPRLFHLKVGDRLFMGRRIVGVFNLSDAPKDKDVVMIATGTGITPYISFLRSHIMERPESKMVVVQAAAHQGDLGYFSELVFLNNAFPNFYYIPTLTDADKLWPGYRMWIEEMLEAGVLRKETGVDCDPEKTHVYLCGNPTMVKNVSQWLIEHGYQKKTRKTEGTLFVEEF
ncbi:MAG TPA: ferredoxin--NADP reductase [Anaerolineae bacterium]|nr:ferredoxin--NADP reductase [Anaerolineae bacterium]